MIRYMGLIGAGVNCQMIFLAKIQEPFTGNKLFWSGIGPYLAKPVDMFCNPGGFLFKKGLNGGSCKLFGEHER